MVARRCYPLLPIPDNQAMGWFTIGSSSVFLVCMWGALGMAMWKRRWWVVVPLLLLCGVLTLIGFFFVRFGQIDVTHPANALAPADTGGLPCGSG